MYTRKIDLKLSVISVILVILLFINSFLLFTTFASIHKNKGSSFSQAKENALAMVDYHERSAAEWEVLDYSAVQNALSKFMYEISLSTNTDELTRVVLNRGNELQTVIRREAEARQANIILSYITDDPIISSIVGPRRITVTFNSQGETTFNDGDLLSNETKKIISEYIVSIPVMYERSLEIEIEGGIAKLVTPRSSEEREQRLKAEADMLKAEIESLRISSGYSSMTSEGIIIRLYDNPSTPLGEISSFIIHDLDVREIVNELFTSGARGIAIDGRRLTATSSIRCVGPLIHVDFEPISVEPIEIYAAGNPDHLKSGLALYFRTQLEPRGIIYEVEVVEQLTLPAYSRRR